MKLLLPVIAACVFVAVAGVAEAGSIEYTTADVGGFVANSASTNAGFLGAIGSPDEFLGFDQAVGDYAGTSFSSNVEFYTTVSGTWGGVASGNVQVASSEMGPTVDWDGILSIDFSAAGTLASVVGFGPVELGNNGVLERIRVYDQSGTLIIDRAAVSANTFNFYGVEGTAGTLISRIELEGDHFAIQDLQFDVTAVPEPTTISLLGLAGFGLMARARRRGKRATS